ncbi:MAG: TIM barrel protein [Planctomycetales bacterium]|nr:TIM barrel protein [Planctomycetales bacterium]
MSDTTQPTNVSPEQTTKLRRQFLKAAAGTALIAAADLTPTAAVAAAEPGEAEHPGRTPNTKFAVNVEMWFGRKSFLEKIELAAQYGFPAIEFWPYEDKPLEEAAKLLKEKSVAVSQFTAWPFGTILNNPKSDHEDFYRKIQQSCDVADQLDCDLFTVVVGNDIRGVSKADMHAAAIRGLKKVAKVCEDRHKTIIIEPMNPRNHPNHCLYGGEDAINICKAVDSPAVKINWDLYHMQIVDGDLCTRMREGFDYIGYLQLADNPGRHEPGTGEVNYTRVFREIKKLGYPGYVGLECTPADGDWQAAQRVYQADTWS